MSEYTERLAHADAVWSELQKWNNVNHDKLYATQYDPRGEPEWITVLDPDDKIVATFDTLYQFTAWAEDH